MYLDPDFEDLEHEILEPLEPYDEDAIAEPDDDPTEVELMVLLSGMVSVVGSHRLH